MNVHLRPDKAYDELLAMRYVIGDFMLSHPQYFDYTADSLSEALEQNVLNATPEKKPSLKTNHPILIVGDFNADCAYISPRRQELLRSVEIRILRLAIDRILSLSLLNCRTINYVDFHWVITNDVKTNTRQTCTYDRVFVNGDSFVDAIVPNSNTTVNYQERFQMTLEQALKISDHLPVKFDINW